MTKGPRPNSETVTTLLDTTWRVAEGERAYGRTRPQRDLARDVRVPRPLLTATLGIRLTEFAGAWVAALYVAGLGALITAAGLAVLAIVPKEQPGLGMAYLERFPKWSEILKEPVEVRGEIMLTLVQSVAVERRHNRRKSELVRWAFRLLLLGLVLVVLEASILGARS